MENAIEKLQMAISVQEEINYKVFLVEVFLAPAGFPARARKLRRHPSSLRVYEEF